MRCEILWNERSLQIECLETNAQGQWQPIALLRLGKKDAERFAKQILDAAKNLKEDKEEAE